MNPDSARVFYLSNTASDISGYKKAPFPPVALGSEATLTGAGAAGAGEVLIEELCTDALGLTSLPAGLWTLNLFAAVSSSADVTQLKAYVYQRTAAGTETEIFNATSAEIDNTGAALVAITHTTTSPTTVAVTDRLVVKVYHLTNSATSKTTTLYLEGAANQSRVLVPFEIPIGNGDMFKKVYDPNGDGAIAGGGSSGGGDAWFDVTDYGATGDGTTDDSASIQDAIDACATAGGGTVYFPPGHYIIAGALQDGSRSNSQLRLPSVHVADDPQIAIILRGAYHPAVMAGLATTIPDPTIVSLIEGTLNTGAGGALLGGWGPSGSALDFTSIHVIIQDLVFQLPDNPVFTAIDLTHVVTADINGVLVRVEQFSAVDMVEPTTTASFGLRTPMNNNGAWTRVNDLTICGYYNGLEANEHADIDMLNIWCCINAIIYPFNNHASYIKRALSTWCVNVMTFTGLHYTTIEQLDIEHYAGSPTKWYDPGYDVVDASNYGHGLVVWYVVLSGVGVDSTFTKNGGVHIHDYQLGTAMGSGTMHLIDMPDPTTTAGDIIIRDSDYMGTLGANQATAALGASATLSATDYPALVAGLAIDGNDTTFAYPDPGAADQWLAIDLGSAKAIRGHRLLQGLSSSNKPMDKAHTYKVQKSSDGTTYTDILTVIPSTSVDDETIEWPAAHTARYFRLYCTDGGDWGWEINTIELYLDALVYPMRLPIGTAGQVLTVVDGLPAWDDPAAGTGAVATDTIWDAKGDLAVGTGSNTAARLPAGSNGQVLTAASGEATGLKWDTVAGSGDVTGPATSADNSIARFNGTDNKTIQGSLATVDDSGGVNIPTGQTYNINGSPHTHALSGGYTEGARVSNNANISISDSAWVSLTFNTDLFDTDAIHDVGSNPGRLTCKTAGVYMITGHIYWAANTGGIRGIRIFFNNTTNIAFDFRPANNPSGESAMSIATIFPLEVNQYVELQAFQTSGGALNVIADLNSFAMQRIG